MNGAAPGRRPKASAAARGGMAVALGLTAVLGGLGSTESAVAADSDPGEAPIPTRPAIAFNRYTEDWSVLADPRVPREPGDDAKYIPLAADDPHTYLSFGANVRERFEANDAYSFGVGTNHEENYVLSRVELHADLRVASQVQLFVQLQSDYAIDKQVLLPVDQDPLGLEQAFLAVTERLADGVLKVRVGRQEIGFDLQRFVSVRDGPNVRQTYDAAWADYERGPWRFISFYSQPVQNRDAHPFDDYSSHHLTYGGFRVERRLLEATHLAAYYSKFTQDGTKFPSISGNERRDIFDVHAAGQVAAIDWDVEGMSQTGQLGADRIHAWALGSLAGYTLEAGRAAPRFGIQIDAASGNRNPTDHELNTFNPLFPNGYYVTLSGYTGYTNLIHVKPSVTLHPAARLKLLVAAGLQWRESTADAVYLQPDIPVAHTAGKPGRYTGTYGQLRVDYGMTPHVALALEMVHFAVSDVIRDAGGHDGDYLGAEFRYGW